MKKKEFNSSSRKMWNGYNDRFLSITFTDWLSSFSRLRNISWIDGKSGQICKKRYHVTLKLTTACVVLCKSLCSRSAIQMPAFVNICEMERSDEDHPSRFSNSTG